MKVIVGIVAGIILSITPTGRANAEPVDCEAARCTVQASIDDECPCADAKNHGRYTACVARVVNRLAREGSIPKRCRNKINGCAIRSTCGKRDGAVSCDFPGDTVSGRCRPMASDGVCTARGGTVVDSCCDSCGAPEPTATATPEGGATETPVATTTPEGGATETPIETATPGGPEPTATETPIATVTAGGETATPGGETPTPAETPTGVVATSTAGGETATPGEATPTAVVATATTGGETATPTGAASATPIDTGTPVETATAGGGETPTPAPTSTPGGGEAVCGDNIVSGSEDCDPPGSSTCPNAGNGLEICSMSCTCNCPSRISFTGDATDPVSVLDSGWTGIAHRAPVISNGDVTVAASCSATGRPCGTCATSGPIPNTQPNQLQNQRCTNDTSIQCTDNSACSGGSCQFFFGSNLPLAAGGVTTCVVNQFNGPITGTANIESGAAATTALLTSRVYNGIAIDNPCPRCVGDATLNDGVASGTCDGGARINLACDGNGTVPGRPDFGTTSLDCPPNSAGLIATLAINLSSETNEVVKTLTADSPNCGNSAGDKCLCDTCNNAAATPCTSNADCPDPAGPIGGICGGKRCLSGANAGAACTANSECPGGSCARPGEPTKPSGCIDDTTVADRSLECADPDGNGEGDCTVGPTDTNCSVASGHAQRGCITDADCGGAAGSCESVPRHCFLTGGGTFQPSGQNDGTDTLTAIGAADPPVNDVSHPTLASVFCVGPTGSSSVNNVAGLPGPGRVTLRGTALGLP